MKKKYIFIFLSFIYISNTYSQQCIKPFYLIYYDKNIIDSILNKNSFQGYLIYQSMIQNDSLVFGENEDDVITFLLWLNKDTVLIKMITKDYIYTTEKEINACVFNYKYIDKVGVDSKEATLKFAPPTLSPFNSDVIIYKKGDNEFFYEFGKVHLYNANPDKSKYRREFIKLIRNEVKLKLGKFKPEKKYSRQTIYYKD